MSEIDTSFLDDDQFFRARHFLDVITYTYIDLTDERSKGDWRCLVVEWEPKTTIIASGRTRAYWFWFISCILSGNIHFEMLWSKMIIFPLLVFCAKCCFNICCEKNQINPSSCWFDVPPLRLHLSIIPNFNINCADSGLSRTLWTVVLFLEFCLVFLLKRDFWGNILYIWSKVF